MDAHWNDEAARAVLTADLDPAERAEFDRLTDGKAGETALEDLDNAAQILALLGPGSPAPEEYNVGGALDRARRLLASAREKMRARDEADYRYAVRLAEAVGL